MSDLTSLYNEADKLKDDGKYEEAIAKLQQVLAEDPDYVLAHLALGVLCGRLDATQKPWSMGCVPVNSSRKRLSILRP